MVPVGAGGYACMVKCQASLVFLHQKSAATLPPRASMYHLGDKITPANQ